MKVTATPLILGDKITLYLFLIFFLLWKEPDVLSSIINILNNFDFWIGK